MVETVKKNDTKVSLYLSVEAATLLANMLPDCETQAKVGVATKDPDTVAAGERIMRMVNEIKLQLPWGMVTAAYAINDV